MSRKIEFTVKGIAQETADEIRESRGLGDIATTRRVDGRAAFPSGDIIVDVAIGVGASFTFESLRWTFNRIRAKGGEIQLSKRDREEIARRVAEELGSSLDPERINHSEGDTEFEIVSDDVVEFRVARDGTMERD